MEIYIVYVLYSNKFDKIYVGYTSDLISRFHSHNELGTKGWTINYRPWYVVHVEVYETKTEAMKREKYLKNYRGRKIISDKYVAMYF